MPATVLLLIQAVTGDDSLLPYSSALEAVLYFYAAYALIRYMLYDHEITRDELWAVGATFTLVAWAFAYTYVVCQAIEPQSFTAAVDAEPGPHVDGAAVPELHHAVLAPGSATSSRSSRSRAAWSWSSSSPGSPTWSCSCRASWR